MRLPLILLAIFAATSLAAADEPRAKKLLLIGIDGCRTDALLAADAPNLHKLIETGAFSKKNDVLGDRRTGADTVTMPGWASMLTGVWADKHGIRSNDAFRPSLYPTFFKRLRTAQPRASTVAFVSFRPIVTHIFADDDNARLILQGSTEGFDKADALVTEAAVKLLKTKDATALFVYFGQVDTAGHVHGFHPKVAPYAQAIAAVDGHVGELLEALKSRPSYSREDWLIIVGADHGGRGVGHSGGQAHEEIRYTFLILNGPAVHQGVIGERTANVDVAVTALTHLGVAIDREWKLDGRPVGLEMSR